MVGGRRQCQAGRLDVSAPILLAPESPPAKTSLQPLGSLHLPLQLGQSRLGGALLPLSLHTTKLS